MLTILRLFVRSQCTHISQDPSQATAPTPATKCPALIFARSGTARILILARSGTAMILILERSGTAKIS